MALKINLGCGRDIRPGHINVDIRPFEGVDLVHDLERLPWPFGDGDAERIAAFDIMEHLAVGMVAFMDECHRILQPGGRLRIRVPSPRHPQVWADPTHQRPYTVESFDYFLIGATWQEKYRYTARLWEAVRIVEQRDGNIDAELLRA